MASGSTGTGQKHEVVRTPIQKYIENLDDNTNILHREMKEIMYNTLARIDTYNTTKSQILDKYETIASVSALFGYIDGNHIIVYLNRLNNLHSAIRRLFNSVNIATSAREYMIAVVAVNRCMTVYNRWVPQVCERIGAIVTILHPLCDTMTDSKSADAAASAALGGARAL